MKARFVRIEGLETPCLIVCQENELPEELIIDFGEATKQPPVTPVGMRTYRLRPTSTGQPEPIYAEIFEE